MSKCDYSNKAVYIGIDVHKKTYACVAVCDGEVVKKTTMPADPEGLMSFLHKYFPGATVKTAYEAGFGGFYLHRYLVSRGIENYVIHPGSIEVAARDRVKTDKRDAQKIATQLAAGRLRCIHIPSVDQEAKRSMSRLRADIVDQRRRVGNKLKSLLFTQGLMGTHEDRVIGKVWLETKVKQVTVLCYPESFCYSVKAYANEWILLTNEIRRIERDLKMVQTDDDKALITLYQSAPGIGEVSALRLKDELGDMKQFANEKQLFSYIGLTPVEHSSGEHIQKGHISRQARSMLRHIFVESAWIAIRKDASLRTIYLRLSKTRGGKKAIVGVARRLAGRLRSCLLNGVFYERVPLETESAAA